MSLPLLLAFTLAAPSCTGLDGWNDGRDGHNPRSDCAQAGDYTEAHRLGTALHQLRNEHEAIAAQLERAEPAQRGVLQRRQRQIDIDLEAIRGVATTRGWPLDITPEITP